MVFCLFVVNSICTVQSMLSNFDPRLYCKQIDLFAGIARYQICFLHMCWAHKIDKFHLEWLDSARNGLLNKLKIAGERKKKLLILDRIERFECETVVFNVEHNFGTETNIYLERKWYITLGDEITMKCNWIEAKRLQNRYRAYIFNFIIKRFMATEFCTQTARAILFVKQCTSTSTCMIA